MKVHFSPIGTGAKKGLSVSIKVLSSGICPNVCCKFAAFLKL